MTKAVKQDLILLLLDGPHQAAAQGSVSISKIVVWPRTPGSHARYVCPELVALWRSAWSLAGRASDPVSATTPDLETEHHRSANHTRCGKCWSETATACSLTHLMRTRYKLELEPRLVICVVNEVPVGVMIGSPYSCSNWKYQCRNESACRPSMWKYHEKFRAEQQSI